MINMLIMFWFLSAGVSLLFGFAAVIKHNRAYLTVMWVCTVLMLGTSIILRVLNI